MRISTIFLLLAIGLGQFAEAQNRVVIAVSTALDGKGKALLDTRIVVSGSKIVAIDLRGLTVMSGWIGAAPAEGEVPEEIIRVPSQSQH